MNVGIIDYGAGNFASVWNAFRQHPCKLTAVVSDAQLATCSHIVLPGVGAFSTAMNRLAGMGLLPALRALLAQGDRPFLGICVGMQVLAARGTEFAPTDGLGAVAGIVDRFDFSACDRPPLLPHMGWNEVEPASSSVLFRGLDPDDRTFYFLHSYRMASDERSASFSYCTYGERFIAALEKGLVYGVQFHPEKSQRNGHLLIANFLGVAGG